MTKLHGGTRVNKGYYFDMRGWSLHPIARDGEPLPGTPAEVYFHAPLPLVFVLAPIMGGAFLIFLPFIGFYLALQAASRPVARLFGRSATEMAATVTPGWKPGEAHLTGRHEETGSEEGKRAAPGGELSDLEKEIAKRRGER